MPGFDLNKAAVKENEGTTGKTALEVTEDTAEKTALEETEDTAGKTAPEDYPEGVLRSGEILNKEEPFPQA